MKEQFLELLREDEEFRYAVAGMLGLEEILRRLEKQGEVLEEMLRRLDRHDEVLEKHAQELVKLREDMLSGFKRHDEALEKLSQELARLREDMASAFKRHDEILQRHAQELVRLREDFNKMLGVLGQVQEEQRRLREGDQHRVALRAEAVEVQVLHAPQQ